MSGEEASAREPQSAKRKAEAESEAELLTGPSSASPESPAVGVVWRGVTPRRIDVLPCGALLCASQGSVVHFCGDALVNAANRGCLGGGGVDGAVNDAGGWKLEEARRALPLVAPYTRCPTGDAKLTVGGDLAVSHVIHAVGPDYRGYDDEAEADALLASAYQRSLEVAREQKFETVAFSLISAAIFRGDKPLLDVLRLAVRTVRQHAYPGLREVHLVAFTPAETRALVQAAEEAAAEAEAAPELAAQPQQEQPQQQTAEQAPPAADDGAVQPPPPPQDDVPAAE